MAKTGHGGAWMTFLLGIVVVAALAIGAVVYLAAPPTPTPRVDVAITLPASGAMPHPSPPPLPSPLPKHLG